MSGTESIREVDALSARSRALAVLRVRSWATAAVLVPAALAVVLHTARATDRLRGGPWPVLTLVVTVLAALSLLAAGVFALVVARARPVSTPTVDLTEADAPDLHRLVRDLADRLDVPAPGALALTPDCDSWLEERPRPPRPARAATAGARPIPDAGGLVGTPGSPDGPPVGPPAPTLVIGSPFLWWMRVGELRAVLGPVVAGTAAAARPEIAAARRFVRGLDAAADLGTRPGLGLLLGLPARLLLRRIGPAAAELERAVALSAAERARAVDYGPRIVAQEQVGLAYAGWDRLLTRVAAPAWERGRWPAGLNAGVVSALTELSRRDRLAEGFGTRLTERPACDLLEEPGRIDREISLLAAHLFHGGPAEPGPDWAPVDWDAYAEEIVDRGWRTEAARLHHALTALDARDTPDPTPAEPAPAPRPAPAAAGPQSAGATVTTTAPAPTPAAGPLGPPAPTVERLLRRLTGTEPATRARVDALAGRIGGDLARAENAAAVRRETGPDRGAGFVPPLPLRPARTGRDLLADHVTALVCCAAVDAAEATPGLDWLDGPVLYLLDEGRRTRAELSPRVLALVEDGDPGPLRAWLADRGIRPGKPVRLV
ncbi:hypothetical protein ACN20G_11355 [Streptomyces sp. BI20]|uniref:hypothetical protein n=1 Tax=Streptomyces sp. BI20 TaxID=3403460 RepID=UPI003C76483E